MFRQVSLQIPEDLLLPGGAHQPEHGHHVGRGKVVVGQQFHQFIAACKGEKEKIFRRYLPGLWQPVVFGVVLVHEPVHPPYEVGHGVHAGNLGVGVEKRFKLIHLLQELRVLGAAFFSGVQQNPERFDTGQVPVDELDGLDERV